MKGQRNKINAVLFSSSDITFTWIAARAMILWGNKTPSYPETSSLNIGNSSGASSMQSRHTLSTFIIVVIVTE